MNKHEFRSAYDKIVLSDEFKARAKAQLTEQFGKMQEKYPTDDVVEEHVEAVRTDIPTPRRSKWKTIVGMGSAAAVVGLGVWGGSMLLNRPDPLDDGHGAQTLEATVEATAEVTEEAIDYAEVYDLTEHVVTFPAYYDNQTEYNSDVFDVMPFDLFVSLPKGWEIESGEVAEAAGMSALDITKNGVEIGTIDFNVYDTSADMPYRGIYSQLMLNSAVSWDSEYTVVRAHDGFESATCRLMTDNTEQTDMVGILAHSDDLGAYVSISIADGMLDNELHTVIAKTVELSVNEDETAQRIAQDYMARWQTYYSGKEGIVLPQIAAYSCDARDGRLVVAVNPEYKNSRVQLYHLRNGRMTLLGEDIVNYFVGDSMKLMKGTDDDLITFTISNESGDVTYIQDVFYSLSEDGEMQLLGHLMRSESGGKVTGCWMDNGESTEEVPVPEVTYDEYLAEKMRLINGYSPVNEFVFDSFTLHDGDEMIVAQCIADAIYDSLSEAEKPDRNEESNNDSAAPPDVTADVSWNGVQIDKTITLYKGSYTWQDGADDMHHDGMSAEEADSLNLLPIAWDSVVMLHLPEDGTITRAYCRFEDGTEHVLPCTADGFIDTRGMVESGLIYCIVEIEYPQGACEYMFDCAWAMSGSYDATDETTDDESGEQRLALPPELTAGTSADGVDYSYTIKLYKGSYIWNTDEDSGVTTTSTTPKAAYDGGLLPEVWDGTLKINLVDGGKIKEAYYQLPDGSKHDLVYRENGYIDPTESNTSLEPMYCSITVEYPEGWCEYMFACLSWTCGTGDEDIIGTVESGEAIGDEDYFWLDEPPTLSLYDELSEEDSTMISVKPTGYVWEVLVGDRTYSEIAVDADPPSVAAAEGEIRAVWDPADGDPTVLTKHGGIVDYAYCEGNDFTRQELTITEDNTILLPEDPIGNAYCIEVEYEKQGRVNYYFVTLSEYPEPPGLTINGMSMYRSGYNWTSVSKGEVTRSPEDPLDRMKKAAIQAYIMNSEKTAQIELVGDARVTDVKCIGDSASQQVQFTESGLVTFPEAPVGTVYSVTVEFGQGTCEYFFLREMPLKPQAMEYVYSPYDGIVGSEAVQGVPETGSSKPMSIAVWNGSAEFEPGVCYFIEEDSVIYKVTTIPEGCMVVISDSTWLRVASTGALEVEGALVVNQGGTLSISGSMTVTENGVAASFGRINLNTRSTLDVNGYMQFYYLQDECSRITISDKGKLLCTGSDEEEDGGFWSLEIALEDDDFITGVFGTIDMLKEGELPRYYTNGNYGSSTPSCYEVTDLRTGRSVKLTDLAQRNELERYFMSVLYMYSGEMPAAGDTALTHEQFMAQKGAVYLIRMHDDDFDSDFYTYATVWNGTVVFTNESTFSGAYYTAVLGSVNDSFLAELF